MVREVNANDSDLSMIELYFDCGVDVNCARSHWSWQEEDDLNCAKEYETLLHTCLKTGNLELVRMVVERGADVRQEMVFTHVSTEGEEARMRYVVIGCEGIVEELELEQAFLEVLRKGGEEGGGEGSTKGGSEGGGEDGGAADGGEGGAADGSEGGAAEESVFRQGWACITRHGDWKGHAVFWSSSDEAKGLLKDSMQKKKKGMKKGMKKGKGKKKKK